jgi:hypothetical protein
MHFNFNYICSFVLQISKTRFNLLNKETRYLLNPLGATDFIPITTPYISPKVFPLSHYLGQLAPK